MLFYGDTKLFPFIGISQRSINTSPDQSETPPGNAVAALIQSCAHNVGKAKAGPSYQVFRRYPAVIHTKFCQHGGAEPQHTSDRLGGKTVTFPLNEKGSRFSFHLGENQE